MGELSGIGGRWRLQAVLLLTGVVWVVWPILSPTPLAGKDVFVSPNGYAEGFGASQYPYEDLGEAVAALEAGDRLLLLGGLYYLSEPLAVSAQGRDDAWVEIAGVPGERAILVGDFAVPEDDRGGRESGLIELDGASFVRLHNLELENSTWAGILVRGGQSIQIEDCRIRRTFSSGIAAWEATGLRVRNNEISLANLGLMRTVGNPAEEAPYEALTFFGCSELLVRGNHVHHCEKEGIGIKENCSEVLVSENHLHHLGGQGIYLETGDGAVQGIEVRANAVHDCEWGIALAASGPLGELQEVSIHHNLIFENRGSGILFGSRGADGLKSQVRIAHNTLHHNGAVGHWSGPTGSIDVRSRRVMEVEIVRNICSDGAAFEIALGLDPREEADLLAERKLRIQHNLLSSTRDRTHERNAAVVSFGRSYVLLGEPAIISDPGFVNAGERDFRLREGSAARLFGLIPDDDLGAIPYGEDFPVKIGNRYR